MYLYASVMQGPWSLKRYESTLNKTTLQVNGMTKSTEVSNMIGGHIIYNKKMSLVLL